MPSFMLLLFLADCRMGHAKIFIGKSWKVTSLEPADGFTSFLAEKLRTIKAVNVNTSTGPKIGFEGSPKAICMCSVFVTSLTLQRRRRWGSWLRWFVLLVEATGGFLRIPHPHDEGDNLLLFPCAIEKISSCMWWCR